MSLPLRKARRDLLAHEGRSLGIAALVAIAVAVVAGSDRAGAMFEATPPGWRARLGAADLEVRFPLSARASVDAGLEDPEALGLEALDARLVVPGVLTPARGRPLAAVIRKVPGKARTAVNRVQLVDGRRPGPEEAVVLVDRSLPELHAVRLGDDVLLRVGSVSLAFPVVGVVFSPEHILTPHHPEVPLAAPGSLAPVWLSPAAFHALVPTDRVNSLAVRLAEDADPEAVARALVAVLEVPVSEVVPAARLPDARMTEIAAAPFHVYMPMIYFAHVCLSVLLLVIAVARSVEQDRRQLGILLALGYPPAGLVGAQTLRSFVPVLLGALLGTLAHVPYAHALYDSYGSALGFPPPVDPGPTAALGILWVGAALVGVLACLVPMLALISRPVSALLRPYWRARKPSRVRTSSRGGGVRDRLELPFGMRFGLLATLRRRRATIGAVLGLGANFAVLIAFTFLHVTHDRVAYEAIARWNPGAGVHFEVPVSEDDLTALASDVQGTVEGGISRAAFLAGPARRAWWRVVGVDPQGRGRELEVTEGRGLETATAAEILLDPRVASDLGVRLGGSVTVFASSDSPEGMALEVVGILDGVSLGLGVVGMETARRIFDLPGRATLAFVQSDLPDDRIRAALWDAPGAQSVMTRGEALRLVRTLFGHSDVILVWGLGIAAIVAALFLAILAVLDAATWGPELATLQALGWKDRTVASVCLTEILTRGILAVGLAVLAAPWLANVLLARLADVNQYRMALVAPIWVPLLAIGAALVFMPFGALPMLRRLKRASLAAVLRDAAEE